MTDFTDLDRLDDAEIKRLYEGVRELNRTAAGHALIRKGAKQHRNGHFGRGERSFEVPVNWEVEQDQ